MTKDSRTNIIAMVVVMIVLAIGIIMRWDYISKELKETFGRYSEMFEGGKAQPSTPTNSDSKP